jgi:tetratricopeptide (TPR) repeat protein
MSEPGRAPRWQWLLSLGLVAGSLVSGVTSELLANAFDLSHLGPVTWVAVIAGVVGLVVFGYLQVRRTGEATVDGRTPAGATAATNLPHRDGLVGRDDDVAWAVAGLRGSHAVALVGRRGVGTSSCALYAANQVRAEFPDGQFYLDLRPAGRPLTARGVLAALAAAFDSPVPASARPAALSAAATALHARLTDRRLLLFLDNVDSVAQVRPLLPPAFRDCRLLFAGVPRLANVDGVAGRVLPEPDPAEAVGIFAEAADAGTGARTRLGAVRTDPAVRDLVEAFGRQPGIVHAVGYRLARHGWRADDVLARFRLAVGAPPHQPVPLPQTLALVAGADRAYGALSPAARRLFRRLSLVVQAGSAGVTGVALDRPTMTVLTGLPPERLHRLLDELTVDTAFVVAAPGDRYEIRPLLLPLARLHLRRDEAVRARTSAHLRLVRYLARRAERYAASLSTGGATDPVLGLDTDPAGWFELNAELLRAVVSTVAGRPGTAVQPPPRRVRRWWFRLAVALCGWYAWTERLDEWADTCRTVLATPTAGDRPEIAGWAQNELGVLRRRAGEPQAAVASLTVALAERRRRGTAQARTNLALALLDLGQVDEAIEHLELAARQRAHADRPGRALTDLALGAAFLARAEPARAQRHLVRAANAFHDLADPRGYAAALTNLSLAQWQLGERLDATQSWTAALREYTTVADPDAHAAALLNAGAALLAADRAQAAHTVLADACRLRETRRPTRGLARTLLYLGDAAAALGRADQAREHWVDAATVAESLADAETADRADQRLA